MANSAEAGGLTNTPMLEQVFVNPDHSSQVLYQLSELWRDKKLCDATIEVGPVKVYVHRLVLLAACPYLLTVGGQHEVSILEVKLPMTVGLEGLNVFLTYLYDGVLHLTSGNLRSVEKLTKILKVTSIQKFCQEFRDSNKETGVADKLSTDYSLKMTNSSLQIIFSEIQSEMKRENTEAEPDTPSKRPRMNLDKLSAALQKKSGQSESGKDSERCHSVSSSMPSETQHDDSSSDPLMMQVKEEPVSDYEDDDDGGYSEDTSESFGGTTDFVRQAPYDTRPFPKEPSATSSNKLPVNIPPPPSLQKRPSFKQKSFPPSAQSSETDVASETDTGPEGSSVDATKVLKNIVKSMPEMAMNLGTSSEMGDDNKPRSSDQLPPGPSKSPDSNSPLRKSSRSRRQVIPFSIPVKQSKSKYASKTSDEELECDLEGNNDTEEEQDVLSYDQNQKLVEWVVESTRIGHSVTINDIRYGCKELLDEEGKLHPFFQDNLPTMKWFKTFRQRNPVINECLKVSSAHGKGKVTAEQVSRWFHSFTDYLNEKVLNDPTLLIDPSRWYMVDIGVALSHWKNNRFESHFAGTYGEYSTHKKTKLMTGLHMLVCMGADGHFQKPMVVQKKTNRHLRIKNMMLKMSQSDWFDSSLFYSWLKNVFIPDLYKRRISRPVVLLIDGMTHLLSFSAFQLCEKNGIILYCMEKWEKSKKPCQLKLFPLLAKKLIAIKKKCRQGVNVGNAELLADLDSVWSITRNAHAEIAVEAFRDMGMFPLDHRVGTTRFDVSSSGFGCPEVVIENLEEEEEISGANADINWSLSFSNYTELIKPSTSMLHSEAATENLAMVSDLHPEVTYKAEVDNLNEDITPFGHKPPVSVPQLMSSYEAVNEDMEDFSDANDDFNSAPSNMEYSDEYGTQQRSSSMSRKDLQHGLQNLVKIPKSSPRKWESCLTEEELAMIRDWILDMHRRGFRIIRHGICSAVKFILDQNNIESSLEDTTQERWFYPFFKKKIPEFIPLQKHKINFVFSRYEMQKWFETLSEYLSASSSLDNLMKDPSRWYMVDVAGFSFHSEDKKLFCLIKGNFLNFKHPKGSVLKKGNALLACMCADGHYPTPMQVVHGNRDKDLPVVQNSIVRSSLNRWVNCNLFKCWLNEAFIPDLNERQVQRPVVLLIDDMSMFLSYEASLICQQNGIFLFCSPKLALSKRPLHTEFFPFFEKTLLKILKENEVGLPELTRDVLVKAVDIASERISDLNEQIAISAFEMMGIFPFNPNNGLSWLEADEKLSGNDKSVSDSSKDNLKSKKEKERLMSELKKDGQMSKRNEERPMQDLAKVRQITENSDECGMVDCNEERQMWEHDKDKKKSEGSEDKQMSEVREVGQIPGSSKERQMSEVREVGQIPGSSKERQMSEDIGIYKDEEKEITNWVEEMASKGIIIGTKEIETSMENRLDKTEHKKIPEWWDKIQHRCPIWSQLSKMNGKMAIEKCFENFTNYINETLKDESLATDQKRLYMLNTAHCNVGPRGQRLYTDVRSKCLKKDVKKKMRGLQVILCMCADGHYPQPMVVMNSVKGYKPSMTKHVVLGLAGMGLIDDIVFMAWIEETFIPHLDRRRIQRPVVLFVDTAVASHLLTFQVYCLCRDNGILLFSQDFSLNSDKKFQTDLFELLSKKWLQVLNDYFRKLTGKQHIFSLLNTTFLSLFDRAWGNTVRESKPFAWEAFCELQVLTSQNTQCASGSGESLMKEDMTKNKANSAVFGGAKLTKGRRQTHSDTSVNLALSRRNNTLDIAEGIEGYKRKETSNYSCTSHEENTQSKRKKTSQHCSTSHEENSDSKRKKTSNYGSTWHARNNVYLKESSVLLEDLDKVIRLHGLTLISGKCEDDTKKVWKQTESSEEIRPRSQHFLNRATTDFNCPKSGSPRLRKSKKPVRSYKSPKSYVSRSPVKLKDLEASCVETEQLLNMSTFPVNTSFVPVPKNCIPVPLPLPSDPDTQDILETARTVIENLASVSKEDGDDVLLDNESMTWGKDYSNHPSALHFKDKTSTVNKDGSEHNVVLKDDDSVIMIDEYVINDDKNDIVIDDNDVCPSPGLYGSEGIVSSTSDDYIHSDGASYTGLVSTAIVDAQDDVDSNEEFEEKIIYPSKFLTVSERIVSSTSKNQGQ